MNSIKILITVFFLAISFTISAQYKTASFKVSGVCSMCKKKIEKAGKVAGVKTITWAEDSQQAKVQFDSKLTSLDAIQKSIAAAGYDTENYSATDNAFKKLPSCCKYDRVKTISKN